MKICYTSLLACLLLMMSCGQRGLSPAELQAKLDSIKKVEERELLLLQGVDPGKAYGNFNPLVDFCDTLALQPLPLAYSTNYMSLHTAFSYMPPAIALYLQLDNESEDDGVESELRAVRLPHYGSVTPLLVATFVEGVVTEMWLYTIDSDYEVSDRLCVYDIGDEQDNHYFAITSSYEVYRDKTLYDVTPDGLIVPVTQ